MSERAPVKPLSELTPPVPDAAVVCTVPSGNLKPVAFDQICPAAVTCPRLSAENVTLLFRSRINMLPSPTMVPALFQPELKYTRVCGDESTLSGAYSESSPQKLLGMLLPLGSPL